MKLLDKIEKIKIYFTNISKIVNFIMKTVGEAQALKDKKANGWTWTEWVLAFLDDALKYAQELAALSNPAPVQTKGIKVTAVTASSKKLTGQDTRKTTFRNARYCVIRNHINAHCFFCCEEKLAHMARPSTWVVGKQKKQKE